MVLPDSRLVPLIRRYLRRKPRKAVFFNLQDFHLLGCAIPGTSTRKQFGNFLWPLQQSTVLTHNTAGTTLAGLTCPRFRLIPFRSPLLRKSNFFLFLEVLRCFNSPRLAWETYEFSFSYWRSLPNRLPHSEITGSKLVCSSPMLIAAYHVLHRLLAPNHPPEALSSLTKSLRTRYSTVS